MRLQSFCRLVNWSFSVIRSDVMAQSAPLKSPLRSVWTLICGTCCLVYSPPSGMAELCQKIFLSYRMALSLASFTSLSGFSVVLWSRDFPVVLLQFFSLSLYLRLFKDSDTSSHERFSSWLLVSSVQSLLPGSQLRSPQNSHSHLRSWYQNLIFSLKEKLGAWIKINFWCYFENIKNRATPPTWHLWAPYWWPPLIEAVAL